MGKIHTLYDGRHVIDFRSGNHTYNHDKRGVIPNATGVCKVMAKPHLIPWAAKVASEHWAEAIEPGEAYDEIQLMKIFEDAKVAYDIYSGERRGIGNVVHDWAEKMALWEMGKLNKPRIPVNPDAKKGCQAWKQWRDKHKVQWVCAERVAFNEDENYIGTIDGLALVDEVPRIIDYKTGKGIWPEAGIQCAAYQKAIALELGSPWDEAERLVLHLNTKSGNCSEWDEDRIQSKLTGGDIDKDYECFLGLLAGYNWIVSGPNKWSFLGKS